MNALSMIGRASIALFAAIGAATLFALRGLAAAPAALRHRGALASSFWRVGWNSLPIVGLTALFTGAALAINIHEGGSRFNAQSFLPQILGVSIVRELGPVLAALMLAGRSASAMAAELGAMRVSDQIDAMTTLGVDPFAYLVAPRLLAGLVCLPLLVLVADVIGVFGGFLAATGLLDFAGAQFIDRLVDFLTTRDVIIGLVKAGAFGFLLSAMGCFFGYVSAGGAEGVGAAARAAVVASAVLIFAANYLLTQIFLLA